MLLHPPANILVGTKLLFEVGANGPWGQKLLTTFAAEVVAKPGPRKVVAQIPHGGQRRPPYFLKIVSEKDWDSGTRWGEETWNETYSGAFIDPKPDAPLTLCINQDFGLLKRYMQNVVAKKADEQRTEEKKTKYISHIAYHLYQMYLNKEQLRKAKNSQSENEVVSVPDDESMQSEIDRVASTLIRLMEVIR